MGKAAIPLRTVEDGRWRYLVAVLVPVHTLELEFFYFDNPDISQENLAKSLKPL